MSKPERPTTAELMRKLATEIRAEAIVREKEHAEKCATILVAARGLNIFRQCLEGGRPHGD